MSTLVPAVVLGLVHVWAGMLPLRGRISKRRWYSFADGVSITYVLVQLFPEIISLAGHHEEHPAGTYAIDVLAAFDPVVEWLGQHAFFPLLVGLVIFYGLERFVEQPERARESDRIRHAPERIWIHIGAFAIYKVIIGYLLAQWSDPIGIAAFAVAMLMHFLVVDSHLLKIHSRVYQRSGRWLLTAAFLGGWTMGVTLSVAPLLLAILMSFVSGGAILMIIQEEFSEEQGGSYSAFMAGVAAYCALLFII